LSKVSFGNQRLMFDLKRYNRIILYMTRTKISKAFQTTISAEAIRALGLRPGQRVNQIVEGKRLILEPVEDVEALAGSLGRKRGMRTPSVEQIKQAGREGISKAAMKGLEVGK